MAPFEFPKTVVSGFKDKIESLTVQGDRLYVGTATGNLNIYGVDDNVEEGEETVTLVETRKGLTRRAIEQIGFIKDINSLVVLSESTVTLYPLPTFSPATPLLKAKAAFSFAIHSSIEYISPEIPTGEFAKVSSIPTLVTLLVVGCRRKVVVYSWKDGEPQESKEAPLPHSPRIISFLDNNTACFAYPDTDYAIFSISTMSATEVSIPLPVTTAGTGMGAFTGLGLGGYMTLGLGAKPKSGAIQISGSEVLILRDNEGVFIGPDATPSRSASIEWPAPPEEIAFVKPYIFSVLPPGSIPPQSPKPGAEASGTGSQATATPTTVIQIRSSISLLPTQTLSFPFNHPSSSSPTLHHSPTTNAAVRLLTPSASAKSPLFFVTTPTDKAAAAAEGSTIWQFKMKSWDAQIDELVVAGQYSDALALLDTIDTIALPDKEQRSTRIRGLNAVSQFRSSQFDTAIDTLIALDVNPAKVVALYPEAVAGRFLTDLPKDGGDAHHHEKATAEALESLTISTSGTIRGRLKGLGAFLPSALKDDDRASTIRQSKPKQTMTSPISGDLNKVSVRPPSQVAAALAAVGITPENQSHEIAFLSETSVEDLFALPNAPLPALTPEQLLRFAQIVDTALFKSYLLIDGAPGSLCRVSNWCEVSEVEQNFWPERNLQNSGSVQGKKMHRKALDLLKRSLRGSCDLVGSIRAARSSIGTLCLRLQDYLKAEQHCMRVYRAGTETSSVYLTLLRIYLRPTVKSTSDLLQPALELIARHSSQLDAVDTLQLLPPLVTTQDIRTFLIGALRAPVFDTRVIRN
ncbi:hypothetical protein B0H13DRAFT_2660518 [Mycena leptocephala]|nr:hypothetical protein B0H13DRAFT_2660518 [Mycena leptocephala]